MHGLFLLKGLIILWGIGAGLISCSSNEQASMPAPLVEVMTIESKDTPIVLTFVGQTEGSRSVEVRAQVSGILMNRAYEEGQYVEKGQLLFEIEPDTYKANLEQAQSMMEQAKAKFVQAQQERDRILPLYKKNAVSQKDRDSAVASYNAAKADLDAAKAEVTKAKIKLGYAYVKSPVSGYASKENKTIGNLITAGSSSDSLLTVVNQVNPIYANFSIPSPQYMHIKMLKSENLLTIDNPTATMTLADGSIYKETGKVTFIDKQVNPSTSVVAARAEFINPDAHVLPGQFVRVNVQGVILVNAILIPQKALIQTQKGTVVAVVNKENKVEMRPVRIGQNYGENFFVYSGLSNGDRVIVEGNNKAIPGQPVRLKESIQPAMNEAGGKK
ncbi:efflux RND transporter periplasmic adaptor subunit [Lawsonia intracellularis]|uniref:efflux RND transporter periplasmic adaptor subunit n=1 Tax=Lawsonia intracellularis TaxID=29546 RepID=UPI000DE1BD86|nr:efflux RND transporter periplasmic adaptor subunit [Lawsonia intracellularis]RBN35210.1 efflux RND transporter periplasmic adaptor subunit [Lawsonia intracellularis]